MVRMLQKKVLGLVFILTTMLAFSSCSINLNEGVNEDDDQPDLTGTPTLDPDSSYIKGILLGTDGLGIPQVSLNSSVTYGTVTIPIANAEDTSNAGDFLTTFAPLDPNATVTKVARFVVSELPAIFAYNGYNGFTESQFDSHASFDYSEAVYDNDVFVIKSVIGSNTLYYIIFVTVEEAEDEDELPAQVSSVINKVGPENGLLNPFGAMEISSDGNFVIYSSLLDDGNFQLFRYDVLSDLTLPVSVQSDGETYATAEDPAKVTITGFKVSQNGRYIVFSSNAINLSGAEETSGSSIFLKDMVTGTVTMIETGNKTSPKISAEATIITFLDDSGHLRIYNGESVREVPDLMSVNIYALSGDGVFVVYVLDGDIIRHNLDTNETVTVAEAVEGSSYSSVDINNDGSKIVYVITSNESGLSSYYLYNVNTEETSAVGINREGAVAQGYNYGDIRISSDGTKVCYALAGEIFIDPYIYTHDYSVFRADVSDINSITTQMVSASDNITPLENHEKSRYCSISGTGRYVAFVSDAGFDGETYVEGLLNGYVRDMEPVYADLSSVTLTGGTFAYGEDLIIDISISGGTPSFVCAWYYKMPGMESFVDTGNTDCTPFIISGAMIEGVLGGDPEEDVNIEFYVDVRDSLGATATSETTTVIIH